MAIQYSGNTQTATFSPANKQAVIDSVGNALVAAGWATVSGGSGTTAWKLQSATTPQGYAIRVLMKDNGGSCVTFSLESSDGTLAGGNSTTVGCFLIPGGYTYKMVLCKYQCFIYTIPYTIATRTFVAFGVPAVFSQLTAGISRLGWMVGNAYSDTDAASGYLCLRNALCLGNGNPPACQVHINAYLWTNNGGGDYPGFPFLLQTWSNNANGVQPGGYRYFGGAAIQYDAVIGWGTTSKLDEQLFNGQLWDAVVLSDAYTADSAATLSDGHNYTTMAGIAQSFGRGTLCLAVS